MASASGPELIGGFTGVLRQFFANTIAPARSPSILKNSRPRYCHPRRRGPHNMRKVPQPTPVAGLRSSRPPNFRLKPTTSGTGDRKMKQKSFPSGRPQSRAAAEPPPPPPPPPPARQARPARVKLLVIQRTPERGHGHRRAADLRPGIRSWGDRWGPEEDPDRLAVGTAPSDDDSFADDTAPTTTTTEAPAPAPTDLAGRVAHRVAPVLRLRGLQRRGRAGTHRGLVLVRTATTRR